MFKHTGEVSRFVRWLGVVAMALLLGAVLFSSGALAGVPPRIPQGTTGPTTSGGGGAAGQVITLNDGFTVFQRASRGFLIPPLRIWAAFTHLPRTPTRADPTRPGATLSLLC